jgi:hypothetical protein
MKSTLTAVLFLSCPILFFSCQKDNDPPPQKPPVANAGNDQTVQLPVNSFTLTGTGTSTNGNITGYLWSLISGPNVPVITSPSSAATTVTGFIAGTYLFQFLVVDNAGLTGIDTAKIIVNPAPIQTLTLQPANNTNELHMGILGGTPGSDPNAPELVAAAWTVGGVSFIVRGLFKFDLSSIPSNATILSAKLTLYSNHTPINGDHVNANSGPDNSMFINRITSTWSSATTNWNNQPSVASVDQISIPHTSQSFLDLVDVDVKNMVAAMVSTNNYGFMIRLQNEVIYNSRIFCSSKYSDATKHPKLVITYQP